MSRKELKPEDVTAIIDWREKLPMNMAPLREEIGNLTTGDYSVKGLENVIAIERKSLPDFLGCVGGERERFDREMQRMLAYPCRALVIEATMAELYRGDWRHKVTIEAVCGSLAGWAMKGIPVVLGGTRQMAEGIIARMLFIAARRRWDECAALLDGLRIETERKTKNAKPQSVEAAANP